MLIEFVFGYHAEGTFALFAHDFLHRNKKYHQKHAKEGFFWCA